MTAVTVTSTLAAMEPEEREQLGPRMTDPTILPLGYVHGYYKVVTDANGVPRLEKIEPALVGLTASIGDPSLTATETGRKYDLYMSQYVGRTSTTGVYEYLVETYVDWKAGNDHMNAPDCNRDLMGVAWGGGELSQGNRGTQSGKYGNWVTGQHNVYNLDIERYENKPQVGMEYRMHEWREAAVGCSGAWKMEWGRASLYLQKTTYNGKLTTIMSEYNHTYATHSFNLTLGGASLIDISPTVDQWPLILSQDIKV